MQFKMDPKELEEELLRMQEVVGSTIGPGGSLVAINGIHGKPVHYTKDGVTVLKAYEPENEMYKGVVDIIREGSLNVMKEVGDGTTSTLLLATEFIRKNYLMAMASGNQRRMVIAGMNDLKEHFKVSVIEDAKPLDEESLETILHVSTNGDHDMVEVLKELYSKVDPAVDLKITETNKMSGIEYEITTDYVIDTYETTSSSGISWTVENPIIYIGKFDAFIKHINEHKSKSPLFLDKIILITNITQEELVIANKLGVKVVQPPYRGRRTAQTYDDLTEISNWIMPVDDLKDQLILTFTEVKYEPGRLSFSKDSEPGANYVESLKGNIELEGNHYDKLFKQARLSKLLYGTCNVTIGAFTPAEIKEKKDRLDDAIGSVRSAGVYGTVVGGGFAYTKYMPKVSQKYDEIFSIVTRTISDNIGYTLEKSDSLVDSAAMILTVMETAISVATTVLNTRYMVILK